ncbi:hypothetical protein DUNSADRAFT_17606 [Dunaliella salina]|uniref:Encoded protein n=1 Tax=Dunaliella salina TaxID=3046 RepID=A0ABQ7G1F7_DUNSA|nr:hypothetical protein DUNSADRAFT_17606 [Dunaliella salina]|eukprot:KAF5828443.1 hypothetical protein DUNSADRAFT_17606 [Dunaliella salina]
MCCAVAAHPMNQGPARSMKQGVTHSMNQGAVNLSTMASAVRLNCLTYLGADQIYTRVNIQLQPKFHCRKSLSILLCCEF